MIATMIKNSFTFINKSMKALLCKWLIQFTEQKSYLNEIPDREPGNALILCFFLFFTFTICSYNFEADIAKEHTSF